METLFSIINQYWPIIGPVLLAGTAYFAVREFINIFREED